MNSDGQVWWAYPGDVIWQSVDQTMQIELVWSNGQFHNLKITTQRGASSHLWDIANPSFAEPNTFHDSTQFRQVTKIFEDLVFASSLTPLQTRVLELAVANIASGRIKLEIIRFKLKNESGTSSDEANRIIKTLEPRFAVVEYDYLALQPLGMLASTHRAQTEKLISHALNYMHDRYDPEKASNLSIETCFGTEDFGASDPAEILRTLQILRLFQLTADTLRGSGSGWEAPQDMEQLWQRNVVTIEQLHQFSRESTMVKRPWPNALLKHSWLQSAVTPSTIKPPEQIATPIITAQELTSRFRLKVVPGSDVQSGNDAEVFKAVDALQRFVAAKVFKTSAEGHDLLLGHAKKLAKVKHPAIVTVHGLSEVELNNGKVAVAIVMEWLDGPKLGDYLDKNIVTAEQFIRWSASLIGAVQAMHAAGIFHGDLGWINILIAEDNLVVIDPIYRLSQLVMSKDSKSYNEKDDRQKTSSCIFSMLNAIKPDNVRSVADENFQSLKLNTDPSFADMTTALQLFRTAVLDEVVNKIAGTTLLGPTTAAQLLELAIDGVAKSTPDSKARIRDYMVWLVNTLESKNLQAIGAGEGKPRDEILVKSLQASTELVAGFAQLVETIVRHESQPSAVALMSTFEIVLEKYSRLRSYSGPSWHDSDFDFFRFIGRQLFLIFAGKLVRDEQFDILKVMLAKNFNIEFLSRRPEQSWVDLNSLCRLLDVTVTDSGQVLQTLHQNDLLAKSAPFDDLCDADFMLALFDPQWEPHLVRYFEYRTPKPLRQLKQQKLATQFAFQCDLDGIDSLRGRYTEIISKLANSRRSRPQWSFTADQIGAG